MQQAITSRLSAGDHPHGRRPPLGRDASCHQRNRAVKALVHATADDPRAPIGRPENLVERLRVWCAWFGSLLPLLPWLVTFWDEKTDPPKSVSHEATGASASKRLTPRGGPRRSAVVGVGGGDRTRAPRCFARTRSEMPHRSVCARPTTTCRGATTAQRTALCAGRCTRWQQRAKQWGREQPPRFLPMRPRGVPGGLLTPWYQYPDRSRNPPAICAPFARELSRAYTFQISRGSRRNFGGLSAMVPAQLRPSHRQRRGVVGHGKAVNPPPPPSAGQRGG